MAAPPLPLAPCVTNIIIDQPVLATLHARSVQQPVGERRMEKSIEAGEISGVKIWMNHDLENAEDSDRIRMQNSIAAVVGGRVKLAVDLDTGMVLRVHLNAGRGGGLHYIGAMFAYLDQRQAAVGDILRVQDLGVITFQGVIRPVFGFTILRGP